MTHLVHVTGPLHDVLERSLTCDIIHQEDSLKSDSQRFKNQMRTCSFSENLLKHFLNFLKYVKMPSVAQYFKINTF